jgi:hypothetical protein
VDHCGDVEDGCRRVLEDRCADERFGRVELNIHNESDHAGGADDKWNERSPRVPRILNASPGDWYQKASNRGKKQHHAEPVDLAKPSEEGAVLLVEFEEDGDEHSTETEER